MKDEIRIGIIGAGANTKLRHIPNLQAIDGVKVVGVCNRSRDSSQKVATEFGIPNIYKNWQEVILDGKVDAIVIGTWPYLHCPATLSALEGGKHVLVEARMGMNADEARKMLGASVGHPELVTQVVPSPMTLEVDETIRRHIHDGLLGRLLVIEVRDGGGWLDPDAPMHWREDIEFSGLNTLTLGILYEAISQNSESPLPEIGINLAVNRLSFVKMLPGASVIESDAEEFRKSHEKCNLPGNRHAGRGLPRCCDFPRRLRRGRDLRSAGALRSARRL
ncbi:hypothetical protein LCGC14_2566940, partial [marine sediment metagenome]